MAAGALHDPQLIGHGLRHFHPAATTFVTRQFGKVDEAFSRIALPATCAHRDSTMGDKSPKSMRKRDDQKQSKTSEDNSKKQAAATAKQVPKKKP